MTTSIVLVTMTKNGINRIPTLLKSVHGLVNAAFFMDTSEDGATADWLESFDAGFPIKILRTPFIDFGTNRTKMIRWAKDEALRCADQTWFLLLDDDHELVPDLTQKQHPYDSLREKLSDKKFLADMMMLQHIEGDMAYWITRLIRAELDWEYRGVTHEYLWPLRLKDRAQDITIKHHFAAGKGKFSRDLALLSKDISRDPNDSRTIFYLAQTLRDMGEPLAAARYYVMRVQMQGWEEEIYISIYEAARLTNNPQLMEKAFDFRPSRAEPADWLSHYYKTQANDELAKQWEEKRLAIPMTNDLLFINTKAYGPKTQ